MADRKLIEEVGKYIDRYYEPARDDIKIDKEMLSVFEKITRLREKRAEERNQQENIVRESCEIDESAAEQFDISTMQKTKITHGMSSAMPMNRNIDDLMNQLEETFSQRLLRMIDEASWHICCPSGKHQCAVSVFCTQSFRKIKLFPAFFPQQIL